MPYVTSIERMAIDKERQTIALRMIEDDTPLEKIARQTGLTIEQVQQLQASQQSE